PESMKWIVTLIELGAMLLSVIVVYALGWPAAAPPRPPDRYRESAPEAFQSCLPQRPGDQAVPVGAFQGSVPLRAMALAGYGSPRPAEQVARQPQPRNMGC